MKKIRSIDDRGVVFVAFAILALVVVSTFFLAWYVGYRKTSIYQAEAEHMKQVRRSFFELQTKIQNLQVGAAETLDVKMSPSLIPFVLGPRRGSSIRTENWEDVPHSPEGHVRFEARNAEYPSQAYIYECGAVILLQENRSVMLSFPEFLTGESLEVHLNEIKILNAQNRISGSGLTNIEVPLEDIRIVEDVEVYYPDNATIDYYTPFVDAWRRYFEEKVSEFEQKGYRVELTEIEGGFRIKVGTAEPNGPMRFIRQFKELYVYLK